MPRTRRQRAQGLQRPLTPGTRRALRELVQRHGWQTVWRELTLAGLEIAANDPLEPEAPKSQALNQVFRLLRAAIKPPDPPAPPRPRLRHAAGLL